MRTAQIRELAQLSTPEKILFVEDLWDTIVSDESAIVIPESHKKELDRRHRHRRTPGRLLSLAQLRARVEARK